MTVQNLIDQALRALGELRTGRQASAEESADALTRLNNLLTSWSAAGLPVYQVTRESFTLAGAASYTIGTGQTFNTARPLKIKAASVSTGTVEQPCSIITAEQWSMIQDKAAAGKFADALFWDGGSPNGNIYLYPKPTAGNLILYTIKALSEFATLGTTVALPAGYERALTYNLAVDIAPSYNRQVSQEIAQIATQSLASLSQLNAQVLGEGGAEPPKA